MCKWQTPPSSGPMPTTVEAVAKIDGMTAKWLSIYLSIHLSWCTFLTMIHPHIMFDCDVEGCPNKSCRVGQLLPPRTVLHPEQFCTYTSTLWGHWSLCFGCRELSVEIEILYLHPWGKPHSADECVSGQCQQMADIAGDLLDRSISITLTNMPVQMPAYIFRH